MPTKSEAPKRAYNRKPKPEPVAPVCPEEAAEPAETMEYWKAMAEEYRRNAESAYERARQLEAEMNRMRAFYASTLNFCNTQVEAFAGTIKLATKGEF